MPRPYSGGRRDAILLRVDDADNEKIESLAQARGLSRQTIVRVVLRRMLTMIEKKEVSIDDVIREVMAEDKKAAERAERRERKAIKRRKSAA